MRESLSRNTDLYARRNVVRRRAAVAAATALPLLLAGVGLYVYLASRPSAETAAPVATSVDERVVDTPPRAPATTAPQPGTRPESDAPAPRPPLPALDESDADIAEALAEIAGPNAIETWLAPESVIRNIVVTTDNLPRPTLAFEQRPFAPAPGEPVVSGPDDAPVLDAANFDRYTAFIDVVAGLEADAVVTLYRRYEPLFDDAYRDLGYPEGDFDARLVEVIDHLLVAPVVEPPIRLTQPGVMYEFADESLESASSGHKLLIRMGPDNAAAVKRKLRQLRAALAGVTGP